MLEETIDNAQRIFIGWGVEIEGAPEKVPGRICEEELLGCGGLASYIEKDTADAVGGLNDGGVDGTGLISVLEGHFKGIVTEFVEAVTGPDDTTGTLFGADRLIADIDPCGKTRKVDIDPIWIFRHAVEKTAVSDDIGIDGIFETIGIAGLVERLVLVGGEVDLEITFSFGCIGAVAGYQATEDQKA